MDRYFSRVVIVVGCVALAARAQADVLISDSLLGSGTLTGHTASGTVGGTWTAPAGAGAFNLTGSGLTPAASANKMAYLDFTPAAGTVYTLSAEVTTTANSLFLGFLSSLSADPVGNPSGTNNIKAPFMLLQPTSVQSFPNHVSGTASNILSKTTTVGGPHNLALVLDTTSANWTFKSYMDGNLLLGSAAATAGVGGVYTYGTNPSVSRVFVGTVTGAAGTIRNLQLTTPTVNWTPTAGGTYAWNNSANWTGAFPNAAGATAQLKLDITANQTLNLNQNITLGRMDIGDTVTTGRAFTIASGAGSNTLTFESAIAGGTTVLNSDTVAVAGTALNVTANVKLGGTSPLNVNLNGTNSYSAKFATLDLNGNNLTLTTGSAGSSLNPGAITGSGVITVNTAGNTSPDSDTGGISLTQNMPGFTGSIKVNNGRLSLVTANLPNAASLEVSGAFIQGDKYPKGGRLEIGNHATVFTSLPDRLPHGGSLILNGGGLLTYWGASLDTSLAGQHVMEQVSQIKFKPGMSEMRMLNGNNVSATTTLLANHATNALVREQGATVMIGGDDMRSAHNQYEDAMGVAEFLKFNSGVNNQKIGGGGAAGSNNISIIPWITIGTLYHPAQGGFATYDANGVRCLLLSEYYTGTVLGAPADVNVRDSSLNLGTNKTQTINAFRTGSWSNTDIGPGSTLTVTSGAILFSGGGPGSNGAIGNGNPANAGTLNFGTAEGIIWGDWATAGPNTIGSVIAGSGGLTKAGTNVLILKGANTYTGTTTVGAGTMQVGDGTLTTSRLGDGNVRVTPGATLRIKSNVADAIDDGASLGLESAGDIWFGTMNLESGVNETVYALWLGGVVQPAGTYGSSLSSATYKLDDYFTGTGILTSLGGVSPVPEPASVLALGMAGMLLAGRRRTHRDAAPRPRGDAVSNGR